jgi:hypothetical protein
MSKLNQNSIIEPSAAELAMYKTFVNELDDEQLDELSNEYFELVSKEEIKVSFPKFLIDKFIRPIQKGDTITMDIEEGDKVIFFCIMRRDFEEKTYLLFCKVDTESETLYHDKVYLFFVDGEDENGTEVIDIVPHGEESQRILLVLEGYLDEDIAANNETLSEAGEQESE